MLAWFKRLFRWRKIAEKKESSFIDLTADEILTHLSILRYNNFLLSGAVMPSYDLQIIPKAGFKRTQWIDDEDGEVIPVAAISASSEVLFSLFMELIDLVSEKYADVFLETSHKIDRIGHCRELYRRRIDVPVLKSILYDFENLLMTDGCSGIVILDKKTRKELQFTEHKVLYFYNWQVVEQQLFSILARYNICEDSKLLIIEEAEHVHQSTDPQEEEFKRLATAIAAEL
jgi:hypothetical protein